MRRVLFVCIHNTARSVMAEAVFNSLARNWRAESAGVEGAEEIDSVVKHLLAEKGLRAKEKPRRLDEVDLEKYDYIVTVCDELSCVALPVYKPIESWSVENPAGKSEEVYRRVMAEIEKKVEELVHRLERDKTPHL
jgi:arsenate reductase